ncbi:SEL1-like repeat protein [Pseudoflavonifractor sp. DSM 107456]|uniref:SEL1-like repeat protein n=1 Tax=Pseudoflavonifractor gallinarum TaxID=2779352 RepID=A0ABR9R9Q7_9FIRM|nr:MobP3 family relaxase [Pseudoflavonifractor gallinarum]MBE5055120.1 SEL1-like repeat protein [Pseudoflavonifractor gallinarum]
MARLILKSPYIKSTGGAAGYLRYIATRERVEILPDDRPPTRKQEQLIAKLVKDFPDTKTLYEYASYQAKPTKAAASAFLTLALESNWDALRQSEQYLKYIATRPRAERLGSHGLFGDSDGVSLEKAMEELEQYTGNVWTHILSLKREDAARLGFDNAAAWRNLIRAHRNEIAAAMKIPPADFRWYAAFHDEGEHPHVHMMAWSAKPGQAYLTKEGIRQIKSRLTNDIFRDEMLHLYEQKSASRDELVRQARRAMLELVQAMQGGLCDHPEAERLMQELAMQLGTVKGKKSYGYLPKRLKGLVDEIVDQMERLPIVRQCYDQWLLLQGKVDGYYHDTPRERLPFSKEKEFRQIKNAVIREAERLRLGQVTFEDRDMGRRDEPEQFQNASYAYWTLQEVIRNEELTLEERSGAVSELEMLAKGGDRYSQYLLGKLWRDGPLLIPDGVNARYWFEQAARQGHLAAQYALAKLYLSDDLEVRDTARGIDWLRTAAEGGNRCAMYRLGKELLKGQNTKQDAAGAVKWFTRSAESGNPYAQYLLGKLYLTGKEVPRDEEQATLWLTRSAEQGNEYARYLLDHREEQRPPDVMLAVTRLLYHMSRVFQDNSLPESRPGGIQIDRKRLRKLREKKIAQGHKPDDHEEQWPQMTM